MRIFLIYTKKYYKLIQTCSIIILIISHQWEQSVFIFFGYGIICICHSNGHQMILLQFHSIWYMASFLKEDSAE